MIETSRVRCEVTGHNIESDERVTHFLRPVDQGENLRIVPPGGARIIVTSKAGMFADGTLIDQIDAYEVVQQ